MSLPRPWRNINRICRSMGISRQVDRYTDKEVERKTRWVCVSLLFLCCWGLLSCTSIRPVIKIGLLAPFEGLQRRSGYVALTAMRQAIADHAPADVAIMPLALDSGVDSMGVERAARKLLQDDAVAAVVGPYAPLLMQPIEPILTPTRLPWFAPFAINPTAGFIAPDKDGEWALPLLTAAATEAAKLGSQRLVLAGWPAGWSPLIAALDPAGVALPLVPEPSPAIQATDAVFWLGDAKAGALYFTDLRMRFPNVPFLLAPYADEPIFSEQTQISGPVYLLCWQDDGYERWRTRYPDQPPSAYLTYRATAAAITQSLGAATSADASWRLQTVALAGNKVE